MRAHPDRHQRVRAGVVMIESSCEPVAFVHGQIEVELPAAASRRIGPRGIRDHRTVVAAEIDPASKSRLDTRGAVEKPRKLGERDRALVIKAARRMTFTQEPCSRRSTPPLS